MCDASDYAMRAALGQRKEKIFRAIYYASMTFNEAQENYSITEKEMLAMVFACEKFRPYILGVNNSALGLLYGHGTLTIYENLLL